MSQYLVHNFYSRTLFKKSIIIPSNPYAVLDPGCFPACRSCAIPVYSLMLLQSLIGTTSWCLFAGSSQLCAFIYTPICVMISHASLLATCSCVPYIHTPICVMICHVVEMLSPVALFKVVSAPSLVLLGYDHLFVENWHDS